MDVPRGTRKSIVICTVKVIDLGLAEFDLLMHKPSLKTSNEPSSMQRSRRSTERRDYATLAGKVSSAPAVNQELIDAQEATFREMDDGQMHDTIKDLELFGFDEFRPNNGILKDLHAEIPEYCDVIAVTEESFWSQVEGETYYDAVHEKKAEKDSAQYGGNTWSGDLWHAKYPKLTYSFLAARLVALIPISSAALGCILPGPTLPLEPR